MFLLYIELQTEFYVPSRRAKELTNVQSRVLAGILSKAMSTGGEIFEISSDTRLEIEANIGTLSEKLVSSFFSVY
jgi:hypothetical protein